MVEATKLLVVIMAIMASVALIPSLAYECAAYRAGMTGDFNNVVGEIRLSQVNESRWRRSKSKTTRDEGLWNDREDECQLAIGLYQSGLTRAEIIAEGYLPPDNPIRALSEAEHSQFKYDEKMGNRRNTAIHLYHLSGFAAILAFFGMIVVVLGSILLLFKKQFRCVCLSVLPIALMICLIVAVSALRG